MARDIVYYPEIEWIELSVKDALQSNLTVYTDDLLPFVVDWGDGTITAYPSGVGAYHNYSSLFTGTVRISAYGGTNRVVRINSSGDSNKWNFNLSTLTKHKKLFFVTFISENAEIFGNLSSLVGKTSAGFVGDKILITGNISDLSGVTNLIYLSGENIEIEGDIIAMENVTSIRFKGNKMDLYGDLRYSSKAATWLSYEGLLMNFTYTPTTWNITPSRDVVLRLGPGFLATSTEVDNLFIDLAAANTPADNTVSQAKIDISFNNAPATSASDAARVSLVNSGYVNLFNS